MIFEGNVNFLSAEIEAQSDKLTYNLEEEMAYLEGNVSGKQNERRFSAEKITINLTTNKVELSGGAKLIFPNRSEE